MVLYLRKLKHLLDNYINLHRDFFDKIKSNHICFNYIQLKYQSNIVKITIYYKIVKKKLFIKNKENNNKKCAV